MDVCPVCGRPYKRKDETKTETIYVHDYEVDKVGSFFTMDVLTDACTVKKEK